MEREFCRPQSFLDFVRRVRSLVLNFENRKVGTNVIELPDREEDMEQVEGNEILANVLNMSLYAFGKWGMIKGLKVDQDDQQLNGLFSAVLKDLKIRPDYRSDHFRFYQEGVQVTYEEVVQAAIEEGKRKAQEPQKEPEKAERERKAGLWHNMCWRIERCAFSKEETDAYERPPGWEIISTSQAICAHPVRPSSICACTRRGRNFLLRRRKGRCILRGAIPVIAAAYIIRRVQGSCFGRGTPMR